MGGRNAFGQTVDSGFMRIYGVSVAPYRQGVKTVHVIIFAASPPADNLWILPGEFLKIKGIISFLKVFCLHVNLELCKTAVVAN